MAWKHLLFLFVSFMVSGLDGETLTGPKHGKVVVCYLASWEEYSPGTKMYTLEDLDPNLCSHIVYAFARLDASEDSIQCLNSDRDQHEYGGRGGYKRVVGYKQKYPHLKVLLAVGGWDDGSIKYSGMAASPTNRASFVKSVVEFLKLYGFDGLDLHWKYPTRRGGPPHDRDNFVLLAKELKTAFEPHGLLLTVATGATKYIMDPAYDFSQLNHHVDYFHMLCYDYHGLWDGVVGANAPLKSSKDTDISTVDFTIKYMMSHGVSPSKMVLGMAAHGRTFQLQNPSVDHVVFGITPVQSVGFMGPITNVSGFMVYNEICLEKMNKSWTEHWDEPTQTPYLRDGGRVISYDNPRSIAMKVKTALDYGLAGFLVWSIDYDDFRGACAKEVDTYVDFVERHKMIINDPLLKEAWKTLNFSAGNSSRHRNTAYVFSEGKLHLHVPEQKYDKYPLMHTINEATTLALEEKRIMDEMKRIMTIKDQSDSSNVLSSSALCVLFGMLFVNF